MSNIEKERAGRTGTIVPFQHLGIGTRIAAVADMFGGRKSASDAAGVSVASLQRYIAEEVQPPFEAIAKMALAAGVSLSWLATGEGQMRPGVSETAAEYGVGAGSEEVFKKRLAKVSEARDIVLRAFAEEGYEPTGTWSALLLSLLYTGEITEQAVKQILQQLKPPKPKA